MVDQLEKRQKLQGVSCPGESACESKFGSPLARYKDQLTTEEICKGCDYFITKPRNDAIGAARVRVAELDEINQMGLRGFYPVPLTTYDFACLRALHRARATVRENQERREAAKAKQK